MPKRCATYLLDSPHTIQHPEAQMESSSISKNQLISELIKSPHGELKEYLVSGRAGASADPEFFSHLIAWNQLNGQVRDAKVALPVIALGERKVSGDDELRENALAHFASLDPRNLLRALRFAQEIKPEGQQRKLRSVVEQYLRVREASWPWWERTALQHRSSMKSLYASWHIKPHALADRVLFKGDYVPGSLFHVVQHLKEMEPKMAAGEILRRRIPFLVAQGALGAKAKDPLLVMALMEQMSPNELRNNVKMLEKLGLKTNPALRAAFEAGLKRISDSPQQNLLKTAKAASVVSDSALKAKLEAAQERQLSSKGIEGDWLVAGDCSSSMAHSIELARQVAGLLARMVKGKVHLIFFDNSPRYFDVSGKTLEEIQQITKRITANGMTNAGCVLTYLQEKRLAVNGIAVISDQGENQRPVFAEAYQRYAQTMDIQPTVYCYWTRGDASEAIRRNCESVGIDIQVFDLRSGADYYSLPNLISTMNTKRFTLVDQILETPLLTLNEVLKKEA